MTDTHAPDGTRPSPAPSRRQFLTRGLKGAALTGIVVGSGTLAAPHRTAASTTMAGTLPTALSDKERSMTPKAFVYTEVQIAVPFDQAPWKAINQAILQQPGFLNKTWFAGSGTNSLGGIYAFDSIGNAEAFVTGYFPREAAGFGVAHTTRIFDAAATEEASRDLASPHFGATPTATPGAFVYTELQVNMPFRQVPWQDRNPVLRAQRGLLSKTWLSGLHTGTIGGVDAFDTLENARNFAVNIFPETAARLNAALYTRVFDAAAIEAASREMRSPYYV